MFLASPHSLSFSELLAHFFTKQKQDPAWQEMPLWIIQSPAEILIPTQLHGSSEGLWRVAHSPLLVSGCPAPSPLLTWGQHLHDLVLVPFYLLGVHSLFTHSLVTVSTTRLDSYVLWEGCVCICERMTKKWQVELTSVFSPHRIPSCLVLKGTDKTL